MKKLLLLVLLLSNSYNLFSEIITCEEWWNRNATRPNSLFKYKGRNEKCSTNPGGEQFNGEHIPYCHGWLCIRERNEDEKAEFLENYIKYGHFTRITELLEKDPSIIYHFSRVFKQSKTKTNDETLLHLAAKLGLKNLVELLIPVSDLNAVNKAGKTAAELATENGHKDIADMIIEVATKKEIEEIENKKIRERH